VLDRVRAHQKDKELTLFNLLPDAIIEGRSCGKAVSVKKHFVSSQGVRDRFSYLSCPGDSAPGCLSAISFRTGQSEASAKNLSPH
jgi:hypothetical protein